MSFTPFTYLVVCLIVQFWILNDFVNSIGKKIYFLYFFNFFYCLNILTTPALGYIYYPANDDLSKLWGWYMKVPEVIYMQNTIPSVIILQLFIKLFDNKINNIQQLSNIIYNIKQSASENGKIGIKLLCIGILSNYIPRIFGPLEYVLYLLYLLIYVAPLYIYYSNSKYKIPLLIFNVIFLLKDTLSSGMFGEIFTLLMATISIVSIGVKVRYELKLAGLIVLFAGIVAIQIIKPVYREITWKNKVVDGISSNKFGAFTDLIKFSVLNYDKLLNKQVLFGTYFRFNQGLILSKVYDYIPNHKGYRNGKDLPSLLASVVVPRLFWKDKPVAGGVYNMLTYTGTKMRGTSMNISPIGEAYGNFGKWGPFYLVFYVGILSWWLNIFIKKCLLYPKLLLWAPQIFYFSLGNNADTIYVMTGVFKSLIFVILFYYFMRLFKIKLF